MSEYVMESELTGRRNETDFVFGFIKTIFFVESNELYSSDEWMTDKAQDDIAEGRASGNIPNDVSYCDLDKDSLLAIRSYCEKFQNDNKELLDKASQCAGYSEEQAGTDLYFTAAGHGVGYADRDRLIGDFANDLYSKALNYGARVSFDVYFSCGTVYMDGLTPS